MITALYGVIFHWIGGLAAGSFYVPFKKVRNWSWETYWLTNGIVSWLLAPTIFALILTTAPFAAIKAADSETLRNTYLGGVCWGVGGLTFGLSIRYLGVGLGNAIALGFCTVFGTLIPPIRSGTFVSDIWTPTDGKIVLLGVLVAVVGIAIAGRAGMEKERGLSDAEKKKTIKEFNFSKGVMIAAFAGIMSAFMAFAIDAGGAIGDSAVKQGTASHWAGLPILIVVMAGGLTTNFIWCIFLHLKNKSGYEYVALYNREIESPDDDIPLRSNYLFSGMAGLVWYLQFFFYTIAHSNMGDFKFSSWTLHMASIIVFSSLWGLKLGEWKGSSKKSRQLLYAALGTLILSTVIIGVAAYIKGSSGNH